MIDLSKRYVKRDGEYYLLSLEDLRFMKSQNKLPEGMEEINWEKEISSGDFISLNSFLGRKPTHDEARDVSKLAGILGVPSIKKLFPGSDLPTNIYPNKWLTEVLLLK